MEIGQPRPNNPSILILHGFTSRKEETSNFIKVFMETRATLLIDGFILIIFRILGAKLHNIAASKKY